MSNQDLLVVLGVVGGIVLFTCVLCVAGVRIRKAHDAESMARRATDVARACEGLLLDANFLWSVWQDTGSISKMKMLIRDSRDARVSTVEVAALPTDGFLKRFELNGKRYEIGKPGMLSNRTCLREAGQDLVLFSADHTTRATTFFAGDGERELFVAPVTSVLKRYRPFEAQGQEIGRLVKGIRVNPHARVLSLPDPHTSTLARVFILASS
ncbi:MAG: hypothetical protein AB7Q76_18450 [Gammaproteobacteria bacterium]